MGDGWATSEYPHDWDERRREIYARDGHQCQNCGAHGGSIGDAELHCHHIVPKSKGGSHDKSNLVTLCRDCHNQVHDHHIPKMSDVNSRSRNPNSGLDDWQSSTQASESLQAVANEHFESDESISEGSFEIIDGKADEVAIVDRESDAEGEKSLYLRAFLWFLPTYWVIFALTYLIGGRGLLEAYNQWISALLLVLVVFWHFSPNWDRF